MLIFSEGIADFIQTLVSRTHFSVLEFKRITWKQGLANVFCEGPDTKYFSLFGHMVSVAAIQLCHCSVKAAIDDTQMSGCVVFQ